MVAPKHKEIDYRNIVSIQRRLTPTKKLYQRLLSESSEIWMNSAIKSDVGVCGWQKVHDLWLSAENRLCESKRNTVALDSCNHQLIHATFSRINSKWRRSQNEFPSSSLFSFYFCFENVHRRIRNAICCDVVRMFRYLIVFTHSLCAGLFVRLSVGSAAAAPTVLLLYKHTHTAFTYINDVITNGEIEFSRNACVDLCGATKCVFIIRLFRRKTRPQYTHSHIYKFASLMSAHSTTRNLCKTRTYKMRV